MTKDKAEKAAIRARMAKTGERYTTARHFLLDHHIAPNTLDIPNDAEQGPTRADPVVDSGGPMPPRVADPGLSAAAVLRATGKTWDEWFGLLDAWDGTRRTHPEIARQLHEAFGLDEWWAQGVTVGYERARGMRARHETPQGFTLNASKTLAVPVERVFAAFVDEVLRDRWLEPRALRLRTAQLHRSARFDVLLPDGEGTRLEVYLTAKADAKTIAALQHVKLAGPEDLERWRPFWKERLSRLATWLRVG